MVVCTYNSRAGEVRQDDLRNSLSRYLLKLKKIKLSEDLVTPKRWGIIEEDTRRQSLAFKRGHAAHILHTNGYTYIHDIHI